MKQRASVDNRQIVDNSERWNAAGLACILLSTFSVALFLHPRSRTHYCRHIGANATLGSTGPDFLCRHQHNVRNKATGLESLDSAPPALPSRREPRSLPQKLKSSLGATSPCRHGPSHLLFGNDACAHQAICSIYTDGMDAQTRSAKVVTTTQPEMRVTRMTINGAKVDPAGGAVTATAPASLVLSLSLSHGGTCQCNDFITVELLGTSRIPVSIEVQPNCRFLAHATILDSGQFSLFAGVKWIAYGRTTVGPAFRPWVRDMNLVNCVSRRSQQNTLTLNITVSSKPKGVFHPPPCTSVAQLSRGRYVKSLDHTVGKHPYKWVWQPNSCSLRYFRPEDARSLLKGKWVYLVGDSTMKELQMLLMNFM